MVPEAYQSDSVRLYRVEDFPSRWVFMDTLLTGREFVDPSVFRFSDPSTQGEIIRRGPK